jgi:hypothetical protein
MHVSKNNTSNYKVNNVKVQIKYLKHDRNDKKEIIAEKSKI